MKLADTLKKCGLAITDSEAIEKAKASLKAQEIIKKAQERNLSGLPKEKTINELLKEAEKEEEKQGLAEDSDDAAANDF